MHLYAVIWMRFTRQYLRLPKRFLSVSRCQLLGKTTPCPISATTPGSMAPAHFGQVRLSAIAFLHGRLRPPSRCSSGSWRLERFQSTNCGGRRGFAWAPRDLKTRGLEYGLL